MRNRVLAALSPDDFSLLRPHLRRVELPVRTELLRPGEPIASVHFLESGLASVLARASSERIEVGLVGFEGLVGIPVILGSTEAPFEAFVQVAGQGHCILADQLRRLMAESATLSATLLAAVQAHLIQIAQTALANGRMTVEQRLARWLLMAQDRLECDELAMTHDFLALMLGVRRPGVTVALHILEGAHAVRSKRALIRITDRETLKRFAGLSYGEPEAAALRLLPRHGEQPAVASADDRVETADGLAGGPAG